jgi:hypothetical protein
MSLVRVYFKVHTAVCSDYVTAGATPLSIIHSFAFFKNANANQGGLQHFLLTYDLY